MICTYLVTNGDDVKMPYFYVVVIRPSFRKGERQTISRFPLSASEARAELFKGAALPSPLAERQLTNIPSIRSNHG